MIRLAAAAGARFAHTRSRSASWLYAGTWLGEALDVLGEVLLLLVLELLLLLGARVDVITSRSLLVTVAARAVAPIEEVDFFSFS